MMTYIQMTGRALTVVVAAMAVASAAADAAENPVVVTPSGGAVTNLKVTADSESVFVQSAEAGGPKLECESSEGTGTLSTKLAGTGETSGTGTVTFKGCKSAAGKCANRGTSEIVGTVVSLLVWLG